MNRVFNERATAVLSSAGHAQNRHHSSPGNWLWQCFTGAEPESNNVESGLGTSSSSDANEDSVALQAHWCRVYAKVRGQPWMQKGGGRRGRRSHAGERGGPGGSKRGGGGQAVRWGSPWRNQKSSKEASGKPGKARDGGVDVTRISDDQSVQSAAALSSVASGKARIFRSCIS